MGAGGFNTDSGGGGVGGWLEKNPTRFQSVQTEIGGQTHNPNRGILFKASWSGFITCRTLISGNLQLFIYLLSQLSLLFYLVFLTFEPFD